MMEAQEIEITIDYSGETSIVVNGIKGINCENIIHVFERLLGQAKIKQNMSEYYEKPLLAKREVRIRQK